MKRYPVSNISNLRDLGGHPAEGGGCTHFGRLMRSDAPIDLSADSIEYIYNLGIRTVIDLRSKEEVKRNPCALSGTHGFDYINYQFGIGDIWVTEDDVPAFYRRIACDPTMSGVMRRIADSTGGVLFHCTAGKDRTGVVAALLLSLAGVSRNDILADYQVSYTYIQDRVKKMHQSNPDLPFFAGYSEIRYMNIFLDWFYEQYISIEAYFNNELGLDRAEVQRIRDKLLAKI